MAIRLCQDIKVQVGLQYSNSLNVAPWSVVYTILLFRSRIIKAVVGTITRCRSGSVYDTVLIDITVDTKSSSIII
jgi:hypothetical protein